MKKKTLQFSFTVLVLLFAGLIIWSGKSTAQCCGGGNWQVSANKNETNEIAVNSKEAEKEVKLPLLLDLGAKKCIPCKMLAPILDELEKKYKGILTVKFIDVWVKENAAEAKKYKINSIPTQIFFDKEGKELWRHVGFISKEDILKKWKELGYDFEELKKNSEKKPEKK
jgi:thioredoxin 1